MIKEISKEKLKTNNGWLEDEQSLLKWSLFHLFFGGLLHLQMLPTGRCVNRSSACTSFAWPMDPVVKPTNRKDAQVE